MATKQIRLQIRGGNSIDDDSILLKNEPGYKDGILKLGDGVTAWKDLPAQGGSGGSGGSSAVVSGSGKGSVKVTDYTVNILYPKVQNYADGEGSIAFGGINWSEGNHTGTLGFGNYAKAEGCYAFGQLNKNNANGAFVFGNNNNAGVFTQTDINTLINKIKSQIPGYIDITEYVGNRYFNPTNKHYNSSNEEFDATPTETPAYSFTGGQYNTNHGQNSFVMGNYNLNLAKNSNAFGSNNRLYYASPVSFVGGINNNVNGQRKLANGVAQDSFVYGNGCNFVSGLNNNVESMLTFVFGSNNIVKHQNGTNSSGGSFSTGWSFVCGANNQVTTDKTYAFGSGLKSNAYGQFMMGTYNNSTSSMFMIGIGTTVSASKITSASDLIGKGYVAQNKTTKVETKITSSNASTIYSNIKNYTIIDRKNGFEVKRAGGFISNGDSEVKGKLTVSSAPTDNNDVVNKKYLETALSNAGGKIYKHILHIKQDIWEGEPGESQPVKLDEIVLTTYSSTKTSFTNGTYFGNPTKIEELASVINNKFKGEMVSTLSGLTGYGSMFIILFSATYEHYLQIGNSYADQISIDTNYEFSVHEEVFEV